VFSGDRADDLKADRYGRSGNGWPGRYMSQVETGSQESLGQDQL
jgi:hypothetical protein